MTARIIYPTAFSRGPAICPCPAIACEAQVFRFPNLRARIEIRAMDEQLAGIALRVRGLERQAEQLEAARDVFEQALEAAEGGREG